ncbi:hypothetical protein MY5147_001824 [Beauveria neobassiana]|nr:hypothetical protein BBAD15_g7047 [Beauveria bassiana D1-5]
MTDTASETTAAVSPAQIAALCVSIFAIIVFTSISIYLYGRRKGSEEVHSLSHNHHHYPPHITRIPDTRPRDSTTSGQGSATRGGRFTKLKGAFGIKVATAAEAVAATRGASSSAAETEAFGKAARMRAASPLQIGIPPGTGNPYSGTEEFQAAVHNLLSYRPGELQVCYHESDDDDDNDYEDTHMDSQPEHREGSYSATDPCGSPLPAYAEVAEPRRFSWQGQESDYRPEKR